MGFSRHIDQIVRLRLGKYPGHGGLIGNINLLQADPVTCQQAINTGDIARIGKFINHHNAVIGLLKDMAHQV